MTFFFQTTKKLKPYAGINSVNLALEKLNEKVPVVVIKRGEKGAVGRHKSKTVKVNPFSIKPVDTTGAGDSFDAGFIYYYLHKNKDFKASIEFANALGALSCLYIGGAEKMITEADVQAFMNQHKPVGR